MIPREILNKIRQIELRTNRLASATLDDASTHPFPKFGGVLTTVPNGNDFDFLVFRIHRKINRVRPVKDSRLSRQTPHQGKPLRFFGQDLKQGIDYSVETLADTRFLFVIPLHRLAPFLFSRGLGNDSKRHFRPENRCRISVKIRSAGFPRPGCFNASSARRSSSAICPGESSVSASANSLRIRSKTSRCSAAVSLRNCSTTSVALMPGNYRISPHRQSSHWFEGKTLHFVFA